jgi:hypothetical protein
MNKKKLLYLWFVLGFVQVIYASPAGVNCGGTNTTAFTAYAVICGGVTNTSALQSVASLGSSGQILMSNGAGALPSFQTLTSYEYAYVYTGATVAVAAGNAIAFEGTGQVLSTNIAHSTSLNNTQITINRTGVYLFVYSAHTTTINNFLGLSVNGAAANSATTYTLQGPLPSFFLQGLSILNITSGQIITVVNCDGASSMTLDNSSTSVSASIFIHQLQ